MRRVQSVGHQRRFHVNRHDNIFRHFSLFQRARAACRRAEGAPNVRGGAGELLLGPHLQNYEPDNVEHARFNRQGGMWQRQRNVRDGSQCTMMLTWATLAPQVI